MGKLIAKIALTGGPCAGKTTTISRIEEHLTDLGYHVLTINECATEIIRNGIRPFGEHAIGVYEFENEILNLQLFKEKRFIDFIKYYPDDTKIILLCDRGSVDVCAYLGQENYEKMLKENNLKHEDLLNDYVGQMEGENSCGGSCSGCQGGCSGNCDEECDCQN